MMLLGPISRKHPATWAALRRAQDRERSLAQTAVTRCATCGWQHHGTVAAGRLAFLEHRRAAH